MEIHLSPASRFAMSQYQRETSEATESIADSHKSHADPSDRQEEPRGPFSSRTIADSAHSGEPLLNEYDRHVAAPADSPGIGKEALFPGDILRGSRNNNVAPELVESGVDNRALDPREHEHVPEHDVDATIASLESQVDHLCSLLDDFRSEFQNKLQAFRDDIRDLPERVGVAYSPRQRAHLLGMYGTSIAESGELALHKLQYDLAHLISLEGDARPYEEFCSPESSFVSCRSDLDSTDAMLDQLADWKRRLRPFASLLQRAKVPTLAPMSPNDPDSPFLGVALDNDDEHTPDQRQEQDPPAQPQGIALRPHREVIIDWDRFCGDCPKRTETSYCKGCSGWRRGFEDPTWDGRESMESRESTRVVESDIEW